MASIEKRSKDDGSTSYRVKVRLKGYPMQTATFERLTDARKWAQSTEAAIREGRHFKNAKARKVSLSDTIEKYYKEVLMHQGSNAKNQKHYLDWWKAELGAYALADVTPSLIVEHRNKLVGTKNRYGREIGATTANRYATALSHLFSMAVNEWEYVESNPLRKIKKLKEPRGRVRFLSDEERAALLELRAFERSAHR